jgi:uncharacterized protein (TIGR03437 family)
LTVYLTGLGAVNPAVGDGEAAPSSPLSSTTNTIGARIGGQAATVQFAGLVPGSVALYQMNVQVPSTATAGDHLLVITGLDSYSAEALIPVGGSASGTGAVVPPVAPRFSKSVSKPHRRVTQ